MQIKDFNTNEKVFIIAEIGNCHEGNYEVAEEMIVKAAAANVDAVKFQTIIPAKLVSVKQTQRIAQLSRFQFSYEQFAQLKAVADRENVMFLSTPFDVESALFLNDLVPAFKIASGDNTFFPLIETVAKCKKPIILSTGMTTLAEISDVQKFIFDVWDKVEFGNENLALLHCVVSYPTPPEQANLAAMNALKSLVKTVGYSDHTLGIDAAVMAVAMGARIIEKHFTLDKNYSDFRDHQLSADPQEMKELVAKIRHCETLLGSGKKELQANEEQSKNSMRRSIVAAQKLTPEHVITQQDLSWVRPGDGLAPGKEHLLVGKKLKVAVEAGEQIHLDMIAE